MVAQVYNWSGCYIGGNAGGKWTRTTDDVSIGATAATPAQTVSFGSDTNTSFIGGGQIGCQWQSGSWVFGLEGDADWQRSRTTRTLGATPLPANVLVGGDSFDYRSDWQASARGRLGYAWDRMLLYVTGGAAFTNVKVGTQLHRHWRSSRRFGDDRQQDAGRRDRRRRRRICSLAKLEPRRRGSVELVRQPDLQWRHGRGVCPRGCAPSCLPRRRRLCGSIPSRSPAA